MVSRTIALAVLLTTTLVASPDYDAALSLLKAKRYPEAVEILEKVVTAEPTNAPAWHALGLALKPRRDNAAYEEATRCLQKASELAPGNAAFLADYGGTSIELAGRTRSVAAATQGRDAMEKAIAMDPENLDAREGLYQFYLQAPFFVGGSSSKASRQLEEIRKRVPDRALGLEVSSKIAAKAYADAFKLCDAVLAKSPGNYTALYLYGRAATVSGQNLVRGVECLRKSLALDPPFLNSPTHASALVRIGDLEQRLGHADAARAALEDALKLEPRNSQAKSMLEKLAKP